MTHIKTAEEILKERFPEVKYMRLFTADEWFNARQEEIKLLRAALEQAIQDNGLLKLALENKTNLLASCETALEQAQKEIAELEAQTPAELSSNPLQLPAPIYQWQHSRGGALRNSWWNDCSEEDFKARDNKPQFNVRIMFETTAQIETSRRNAVVQTPAQPIEPAKLPTEWRKNVMRMWQIVRKHDSTIPSDDLDLMREILFASQSSQPEQEPVANLEQVQFENIRKVVKALADFCFESPTNPEYGSCHVAITTSLTAKDGIDFAKLNLKSLYTKPATQGE